MEHTKRLKKRQKISLIFSLFLIILGFTFLSSAVNSAEPSQNSNIEAKYSTLADHPAKIYIPKLNKTLAISDGYVQNDRWTISDTGVSFLTSSALPGQPGNSIIYGHNKKNILGDLEKVKTNDIIYIVMKSGNFYAYEVFETKVVKPNQVEILTQSQDEQITIYTCTGFLDQARFVVFGKLIRQENLRII